MKSIVGAPQISTTCPLRSPGSADVLYCEQLQGLAIV
jgi:hypothetical protein